MKQGLPVTLEKEDWLLQVRRMIFIPENQTIYLTELEAKFQVWY
jgi:hypothetical protein